jgi:DNA-directed RNA polymerase omega subunit
MKYYPLEDFPEVDSLYRLVNICARRASQINKAENRALVPAASKKSTIIGLEEVLAGKVGYRTSESEEDDYDIG